MWPKIWAIVHISQSLLVLNVLEKRLRVLSGVPETRRHPSGLRRRLSFHVKKGRDIILKLVGSFYVKKWP